MNILILSSATSSKNASIVMVDLMKSIESIDNSDVRMVVRNWDVTSDNKVIAIEGRFNFRVKSFVKKINNKLVKYNLLKDKLADTNRDYNIRNYNQTVGFYSTKRILKNVGFKPDFVFILAMQHAYNFKNLYEIYKKTNAPILLYMMDMAPLTGGCHYAWDCKGYLKNCGNCPAYYSISENDQSRINWTFKNEFISKTKIIPIAGSEWLYRQLLQSSLYKDAPKHKLLLSINNDVFRIVDTTIARKKLNLPNNKKIIFFGAVSYNVKRKGFNYLIDSLKLLHSVLGEAESKKIHLAIAGTNNQKSLESLPFNYSLLGYLSHEELSEAYNAADVFVSPSIEDSGPMMVNQSIMCGTPVVAFEIGIALDLVITGKTGYRAKLKDKNDLATGIKYILELCEQDYKIMCNNCREHGLALCHPKKQAGKIKELISIISKTKIRF